MGGFVAVYTASQRPDLFSYVAGMSGGYDLSDLMLNAAIVGSTVPAGLPLSGPFFGNAAEESPQAHLDRFESMHVSLWAGTGFDFVEPFARSMTQRFHDGLQAAGHDDVTLDLVSCGHNFACMAETGMSVEFPRIFAALPEPSPTTTGAVEQGERMEAVVAV